MITDRYKILVYALLILCTIVIVKCAENQTQDESGQNEQIEGDPEGRALFSPRVDYNEWMPVGRGDPLKKDPTYDYSPPVLDRVHYWGSSNKSKEKKEILLLGVTAKRSHKKEPKYNSVMRRNYYSQHLPTRLMPPPMQTIQPSIKYSSTESYYGMHYHNNYNTPSQSWSHNNIKYGDSNVEESINYLSIARPTKNSIRNEYSPQYVASSQKPWLHALLEKEVTKSTPSYVVQSSKSIFESHPPSSSTPSPTIPPSTDTTVEETPYFQPTVPSLSMTTDSLFSHYKQPPQPIAGPMYLIIEGHSKVKTYGLKDNTTGKVHAPKIVPIQAVDDAVIKHVVSKDENGQVVEVKHLHKAQESVATTTSTPAPKSVENLLSLLDTSLGNFFLESDESPVIKSNIKENSSTTEKMITDREGRQVFDYDDLPESLLREQDEIVDDGFRITVEPKNLNLSVVES